MGSTASTVSLRQQPQQQGQPHINGIEDGSCCDRHVIIKALIEAGEPFETAKALAIGMEAYLQTQGTLRSVDEGVLISLGVGRPAVRVHLLNQLSKATKAGGVNRLPSTISVHAATTVIEGQDLLPPPAAKGDVVIKSRSTWSSDNHYSDDFEVPDGVEDDEDEDEDEDEDDDDDYYYDLKYQQQQRPMIPETSSPLIGNNNSGIAATTALSEEIRGLSILTSPQSTSTIGSPATAILSSALLHIDSKLETPISSPQGVSFGLLPPPTGN